MYFKLLSIALLSITFFSCSFQTENSVSVSKELNKYIEERYGTKDINYSVETNFKDGKKETSFKISLGISKAINDSKSDIELFASDIALRIYSELGKADQKKYDIFAVKITKNKLITEFKYENKRMQEATDNLQWLEMFLNLVDEKEYIAARWRFDLQFVDTSKVDLAALYEPLEDKLGKFKNRELWGFTIGGITLNGKEYKAMEATYVSIYGKKNTMSHYTILMNDSEQRLLNIKMD